MDVKELADRYFGSKLREELQNHGSEVSRWWKEMDAQREKWESFLDKADDCLGKKGKSVSIVYDELDRICSSYGDLFLILGVCWTSGFSTITDWPISRRRFFCEAIYIRQRRFSL